MIEMLDIVHYIEPKISPTIFVTYNIVLFEMGTHRG